MIVKSQTEDESASWRMAISFADLRFHVAIERSKQPTHEGQHLSVLCRKYGLQKRQIAQLFAV